MKKIFNIEGMSCSACSAAVERVVGRLKGVKSASVNLVAKTLRCEYDPNIVDELDVIKAVEKAGFSATLVEKKKKQNTVKETKSNLPSVKFRLIFSIILLLPITYLSMGKMIGLPLPNFLDNKLHPLIYALVQMVLATPILYVNRKFFYSGFKALFHRAPNMDTLVMTGSGVAYLFSVFSIFMIAFGLETADTVRVNRYVSALYFDSAAMILTLITIGKLLEEKAKNKTGNAIESLKKLAPETAVIIINDVQTVVKTAQLKVGDLVVVKNGESVPVDGEIIEGGGYFDQSAITGESLPIYKTVNDKVVSATINTDGYVVIKATAVGELTTLSKIIDMVRDAGASKAPIARLADKISGIFVPVVMCIALVTLITWLIIGVKFEDALSYAVSVLVISCPCALGLATPVAVTASIGSSAKKGVLIKSAEALELLAKTDVVTFDKTGTLTIGKPKVNKMIVADGVSDDELKSIAVTLEEKNSHPLALAVLEYCKDVIPRKSSDYVVINGKGVKCVIDGEVCLVGNQSFVFENDVDVTPFVKNSENLYDEGNTVLWFAKGKNVIGLMSVSDVIKDDAKQTVRTLKDMGLSVQMISGDNEFVCRSVKDYIGLDVAYSNVLPNEKEQIIDNIIKDNKKVVFVGDGINDSPALTRANVGIAVGDGTAIAIDSADVVLVGGDIAKVPECVKKGKKTLRIIKQNLFWAFIYNLLLIPIAAGAFSVLGFAITPMLGSLAMSLSSLFVVTNALRLLK